MSLDIDQDYVFFACPSLNPQSLINPSGLQYQFLVFGESGSYYNDLGGIWSFRVNNPCEIVSSAEVHALEGYEVFPTLDSTEASYLISMALLFTLLGFAGRELARVFR